jgi:hypothetical protein
MGVRDGLDDLLSGWNEALKVIFMLSLIVGADTLAVGLMATSPVVSTGYTCTVLSTCARFCTCLAAFILILDLSVLMGSHGYIARIILGLVSVLFSVSVWIKGDPAAYGVYMRAWNSAKHLCGCFKWSRQRGPILPTWRHYMFLVRVLYFCWPRSVHSLSLTWLLPIYISVIYMMAWQCIMPRFVVHELLLNQPFCLLCLTGGFLHRLPLSLWHVIYCNVWKGCIAYL